MHKSHSIVVSMLASTPFFLLFQDGGLLINNPTALAIHECKCLWPNTPLQCVLSLGTGRYETEGKNGTTYTSLKAKLTNVISSATDTEGRSEPLAILREPSVTLVKPRLPSLTQRCTPCWTPSCRLTRTSASTPT